MLAESQQLTTEQVKLCTGKGRALVIELAHSANGPSQSWLTYIVKVRPRFPDRYGETREDLKLQR